MATAQAAVAQATRIRWKRYIWTAVVASITIAGSVYGAGLKMEREVKTAKKAYQEATVAEQIAVLEEHRNRLIARRAPIERKLAAHRAKMKEKEEEEKEKREEEKEKRQAESGEGQGS